ncbi:RNA-directed DNA polymerase, eukaryota, partial [Tanacetum coccineum]
MASLANIKIALGNEGFEDITIKYMGELWILIEFMSDESKNKFKDNVSVVSWFSQIIEASSDFEIEGRIAWVEVEGVPFKLWSGNTFSRIANKWGKLLDVDDQEETCFHSKRLCIHMKSEQMKHRVGSLILPRRLVTKMKSNLMERDEDIQKFGNINENSDSEEVPDTLFEDGELVNKPDVGGLFEKKGDNSEDPFNLYSLLNRKNPIEKNVQESEDSLEHPPGFTPVDGIKEKMDSDVVDKVQNCHELKTGNMEENNDAFSECRAYDNLKGNGNESSSSGHFKKSEIPRTGGSIIGLLEEVVQVGQVMGYKMEGLAQKAKKDWVKELCIKNKVNYLAIQETKMENMENLCVRQCWGNLGFDHVHSDAVGNSGGILCVWDPNSFSKNSVTVSDYFVMCRGHWRLTDQKMMIIAVYAPQESKEKQNLWEYLHQEIARWKGEVIVMGDFNEVRFKSDRYGSHFNSYGAQRFNSFISDAGLVEVALGGSHFTWCHKSATKMSKLDRFLV